jgi:hypothetical protein
LEAEGIEKELVADFHNPFGPMPNQNLEKSKRIWYSRSFLTGKVIVQKIE